MDENPVSAVNCWFMASYDIRKEDEADMEQKRPPLPYFMVYPYMEQRTEQPGREDDRDYFRQLYPQAVKRYLRVITEILDTMETKESYIYDEYPDKVSLERLSEVIRDLVPLESGTDKETQKDMIKILLYEEIIRRRNRK